MKIICIKEYINSFHEVTKIGTITDMKVSEYYDDDYFIGCDYFSIDIKTLKKHFISLREFKIKKLL